MQTHIIESKRDTDGNHVGKANDNPILYSQKYMVEFKYGKVTKLTANIIADSIYDMCKPEGERVLTFDCIVYFKCDRNTMTLTDHNFVESCGKAKNYISTNGWQIYCQQKD